MSTALGNCCCRCVYDQFAFLICNCNDVQDDTFAITLNGHTLTASLDMPAGIVCTGSPGPHYPGKWWATDTDITLEIINQLINFDTSGDGSLCLAGMDSSPVALDPTWLVDGDNEID